MGSPSFFTVFDAALAVLAVRSIVVLRGHAPWTSAGWLGTLGYGLAKIVQFSDAPAQRPAAAAAYVFLIALAAAFVVAGVRDEPQAEPWWWPRRPGPTRAMRRAHDEGAHR